MEFAFLYRLCQRTHRHALILIQRGDGRNGHGRNALVFAERVENFEDRAFFAALRVGQVVNHVGDVALLEIFFRNVSD